MQPHPPGDRNVKGWVIAGLALLVLIALLTLWAMRPSRQGQPGEPGHSAGHPAAAALVVGAY